ncbi:MAG: WD40 repeat domain-containing protein [Gemmataceae bacterium]|nr:WD40 repeat domain-containing protein [Gemmataceae bacterium]
MSDASVGKKVKCSCGNVFVADEEAAAPPMRKPAAVADKVTVACTECSSPLKVGSASLGKKIKCPKCAAVFIASAEGDAPPPIKKFAKPMPPSFDEDDVPKTKGKAKGKAPANDDDMDGLWGFSQEDDDAPPPPKAKGKSAKKPMADDDDDDMPTPKRKASSSRPTPVRTEAPVYPSRMLLNLSVILMLLVNMGAAGVIFFGVVKTEDIGIPHPPKIIAKAPVQIDDNKKKNTIVGERLVDAKTTLADLQKREQVWLADLKKGTTNPDYLTEFETDKGSLVAAAFSPDGPILATLAKAAEGDEATIEFWDLKTAKKAASDISLKTTAVRPQLRFSTNGVFLAVSSWEDKWVKVFNTSDGKEVASPKIEKNPSAMSFSAADGKLLLVAFNTPAKKDATVEAWTVGDWKPVVLGYKIDPEGSHTFLADGSQMVGLNAKEKTVAFHGSKDAGVVKKCDSKVDNELYAFSSDGRHLVFAIAEVSGGTSLFINDLNDGKDAAKELAKVDFVVGTIQFSADAKHVLYTDAKDGKPFVIDVGTQQVLWSKSDGLYLSNAGLLAAEVIAEPKMPTRVLIHSFADLIVAKKTKDPKDVKKTDKKDDAKTDKKDDAKTDKKDDAKTDKKDDAKTDKKDDAKTDKNSNKKDLKDDNKLDKNDDKGKDDKGLDKKNDKSADNKKTTEVSFIVDRSHRTIVASVQPPVSIRLKVTQLWKRDQAS